MEKLTGKQLENWRKLFSTALSPYALIMPAEDIQRLVEQMQTDAHRVFEEESDDEDCEQ